MRFAQLLASVVLVLSPIPGVITLALTSLFRREFARVKPWATIWVPTLLLLAIGCVSAGTVAPIAISTFIVSVAGLVLLPPKQAFVRGLTIALLTLLGGTTVQYMTVKNAWSTHPWQVTSGPSISRGGIIQPIRALATPVWAVQSWKPRAQVSEYSFAIDARVTDGTVGKTWLAGNSNIDLRFESTDGGVMASATDIAVSGVALYRTVVEEGYVSGRTYRATVRVRGEAPPDSTNCRGFVFQQGESPFQQFCVPFELSSDWTEESAMFNVPPTFSGTSLRVGFVGWQGATLELLNFHLEELTPTGWVRKANLIPNGIQGRIEWEDSFGQTQTRYSPPFSPSSSWNTYHVGNGDVPLEAQSTVRLVLTFEQGANYEVRGLSHQAIGVAGEQVRLENANLVGRLSLWFDHPNIAGHTFAVVGLAVVLLAGSPFSALVSIPVTIFLLAGTGSRLAFWVYLLGSVLIFVLRHPRWRLATCIFIATMSVCAIVFAPELPGRIFAISDSNPTTRTEIMALGWESILSNPFGQRDFETLGAYARTQYGEGVVEDLAHAHNLWLEAGFHLGFPGILAFIWLCLSLCATCYVNGGFPRLVFALAVFFLSVLDFTFLYGAIPFLFVIVMNLREFTDISRSQTRHLAASSALTNSDCATSSGESRSVAVP